MNNIEKLAIEHGAQYAQGSGDFCFMRHELEAFAKAYALSLQSSEPVAVQTKQIYEVAINGSWMESNLADYVKHRGIKRTLFTLPPASVSLEKYNKLFGVLKDAQEVLEETGYRDCLGRVNKAIAEAEGKS